MLYISDSVNGLDAGAFKCDFTHAQHDRSNIALRQTDGQTDTVCQCPPSIAVVRVNSCQPVAAV